MKLSDSTRVGLCIAAAAMAACGKSPASGEATLAVRAVPTTNAAPNAAAVEGSDSLGVAVYPGAETLVAAHRIPGGPIVADFKSPDKPERVVAFYRDLLSKKSGEGAQYLETPMGEGLARIQATDGKQGINIMVRPEGDGSIVGIQVTGRTN
jgi:hypothetical protein